MTYEAEDIGIRQPDQAQDLRQAYEIPSRRMEAFRKTIRDRKD